MRAQIITDPYQDLASDMDGGRQVWMKDLSMNNKSIFEDLCILRASVDFVYLFYRRAEHLNHMHLAMLHFCSLAQVSFSQQWMERVFQKRLT